MGLKQCSTPLARGEDLLCSHCAAAVRLPETTFGASLATSTTDRTVAYRSARSYRSCPRLAPHALALVRRKPATFLDLHPISAPFAAMSMTHTGGPPPFDFSPHDDCFEPSPIYFGQCSNERQSFVTRQHPTTIPPSCKRISGAPTSEHHSSVIL
ncbi:hypothetical protein Salat_1196300 [Sesamum alatum]|uniref:Uncharacterized protein n=1 Tax=Sesamum alatum TaxID=300844 RepID=A0AAE1YF71_9LAMI|nr:hypothetical protein Salat_1196300 [Sesamum alatum]